MGRPISYYLVYFIQILLVIHVIRTGRNRLWIWPLIFIPLFGGIAYVLIEILPELGNSMTGRKTLRGVRRAVNPLGDLRRLQNDWERSPNADNARHYAQALIDSGKPEEAEKILDQAMTGLFRTEPNLMLMKAQAEFSEDNASRTVETLEALKQENPDFKSPDGHLLLARALEASGRIEESIKEYAAVSAYFPGAEARYRYALALSNAGHREQAAEEFAQMTKDARLAPRHFQKSQRYWLKLAAEQLRQLR